MGSQRALLTGQRLVREYTEADLSPVFRANGTQMPDSDEYAHLLEREFVDWRLQVDGLVQRPQSLSLAELKRLPSRTQITRHDCVEGWSAIGKWQGVPLGHVLDAAGLKPGARYVVLHCADELEKTLALRVAVSPAVYRSSASSISYCPTHKTVARRLK